MQANTGCKAQDTKCLFFQWKIIIFCIYIHLCVHMKLVIKSTQVLNMAISCLPDPSHHPGPWLTHSNVTLQLYPLIPTQQHIAWGYAVYIFIYVFICLWATFYAPLIHSGAVVVSCGIIFIYIRLFYLNIWQRCSVLMCSLRFGKERSVCRRRSFSVKVSQEKNMTSFRWEEKQTKRERKKKKAVSDFPSHTAGEL